MAELLKNKTFVWGAMSLIVLLLSQLLKLPIKALTKKTIKDKTIRDRVNIAIMLIPLALGILCDWLFCTYYAHTLFSVDEGVKVGFSAITLYGILERAFKGKKSKKTTELEELGQNVFADGKIDKNDISAVQDYLNKVK